MEEIPEISITLRTMFVKGGPLYITHKKCYNSANFFGKLKMMWRWYWNESRTMSWLAYLDSPVKIKWLPELAQDVSAFHNIDAETELIELLKKEDKKNG